MKTLLISLLFLLNSPVMSHTSNYSSYEDKCFKRIYKEKYIPGDSLNPGYVKSWEEDISIRCENDHNHAKKKIEKGNTIYKPKKCNETLGSLIGGGVAASLSAVDAYGWSIPLGLVLGKGIANADC